SIGLVTFANIFVLTEYKKWKWLWDEWLTTVDHKKIGAMYLFSAVIMLIRGGMDGLMIRAQLTFPEKTYLNDEHYNGIFPTHG
ncbi:cbb3-type cytochrome c oxidase subunit I, partial [Bacillus cereus]|uniref:cbb3-type cytochrome c oxidase subunit I n=1 Tax=Bacillus cereus TaxID=1396 RepID=UPI0028470D1A|nr:cytochrome ubiquinol oxidase subunit I [Bacillus cereus]